MWGVTHINMQAWTVGNEGGPAFPEQSRSKVLSTEQAAVLGFQVALV